MMHTHNTQAFLDGGLAALLAGVPGAHPHRSCPQLPGQAALHGDGAPHVLRLPQGGGGLRAHRGEPPRVTRASAPSKLAVVLNGIDGAWYRAERDRLDRAALRRAAGPGRLRHASSAWGCASRSRKASVHLLDAMPEVAAPPSGRRRWPWPAPDRWRPRCAPAPRRWASSDRVRFLGAYPAAHRLLSPARRLRAALPVGRPAARGLLEAMSLGAAHRGHRRGRGARSAARTAAPPAWSRPATRRPWPPPSTPSSGTSPRAEAHGARGAPDLRRAATTAWSWCAPTCASTGNALGEAGAP